MAGRKGCGRLVILVAHDVVTVEDERRHRGERALPPARVVEEPKPFGAAAGHDDGQLMADTHGVSASGVVASVACCAENASRDLDVWLTPAWAEWVAVVLP